MKDTSLNRTERSRRMHRRNLIKWSLATGAALGLPVWKTFEVLEDTGGYALAGAAACRETNRSVHIQAGRGGLGWFTLLYPHPDLARAANSSFSYHDTGNFVEVSEAARDLVLAPVAPQAALSPAKQVTCILGGSIRVHTRTPTLTSTIRSDTSVFAACAAMQLSSPVPVPVITVGNQSLGTADGAPRAASVPDAGSMISLFDSVASQMGGALERPEDAELFQAYYNAFLSLNAAAGKPGTARAVATAQDAARLLGTNHAAELTPTIDDRNNYGLNRTSNERLHQLGEALIITAKAFKLQLTNMVVLPAFQDDPHSALFGSNNLNETKIEVGVLGQMLDQFFLDLAVPDETCAGTTILDNTVLSIHGDTPRTAFQRRNWPDDSAGECNITFVYGAGHLQSGWFGSVDRSGPEHIQLWDPATGANRPFDPVLRREHGKRAAAAVAYAVARGDRARVDELTGQLEISGLVA